MTKEELQKVIGKNLHRTRFARDLTQEELSEQAGISSTFYANLECGNKMMSIVTLRRLADTLGVSTDSLLYEDREDDRLKSIQLLLKDQPDPVVAFVERMVRLCVSALPLDSSKTEEEDAVPDECGV